MTQTPLKVLFVAHLGDLKGGADAILLRLIENLDRNRIEPLVLLPVRGTKPFQNALEKADIPYLTWHYNSWINYHHHLPRKVYRLLSNLIAAFILSLRLRGRIEAIHTNSLYSPLGVILARILRVPHLWYVHEFIEEDMGATFDWGRERSMTFLKNTSQIVLCNSQVILQKMAQFVPSEKLKIVYYGIFEKAPDLNPLIRAQPLHTNGTYQIGIVGRLSPAKGQNEAILAIHHLLQQNFDVHLHLAGVGTPAYTDELRQLVDTLGIESHLTWHGFVDPFSIYQQVDVNLVCSRSEAFGMVVVEPMSIGCPVIGANAGAIPELIGNEERGLSYPPGDYAALADQIKRLLSDSELYHRLSSAACHFAYQNFIVQDYVDKVEALLLSMKSHKASTK